METETNICKAASKRAPATPQTTPSHPVRAAPTPNWTQATTSDLEAGINLINGDHIHVLHCLHSIRRLQRCGNQLRRACGAIRWVQEVAVLSKVRRARRDGVAVAGASQLRKGAQAEALSTAEQQAGSCSSGHAATRGARNVIRTCCTTTQERSIKAAPTSTCAPLR